MDHNYPHQQTTTSQTQQHLDPPANTSTLKKQQDQSASQIKEIKDQKINQEIKEQPNLTYTGATLTIIGTETKSSMLTKYTAYIIEGEDKNGSIHVCRRFNQFFELRVFMVKRWPGCFIPSLPSKNFIKRNDRDMIQKRQRYLNDFLIKMTKIPHLYKSEEFQAFLRSKEVDVAQMFSKWPATTHQQIINKYRDCFSFLEGKTINQSTNERIAQFYANIKKNQSLLQKYRAQVKALALARERYNLQLPKMFELVFKNYEKNIFIQYVNGKQQSTIVMNQSFNLGEHCQTLKKICKSNPYWLLYDLIKNEERDGRAFIEALSSRQALGSKMTDLESRISSNDKKILKNVQGRTSLKQEHKEKLQSQTEQLKKQKDKIIILSDIINALIVYLELETYEVSKARFYHETIRRLASYQLENTQVLDRIWLEVKESGKKASTVEWVENNL